MTWIATAFIGVWLIGYLATQSRELAPGAHAASQTAPAKPAESSPADKRATMAVIGARSLKSAMRDPESFKLEQVLSMPEAVCYTYRAHNGFGGVNVGRAALNAKSGKLSTSDQDGFSATWNKLCGGKSGDDLTTAVRWSM